MEKTTTNKKFFVILWQSEIEKLKSPTQIAVYQAIKSYSSNGKKEIALSLREISVRAKVSYVCVLETIPQLIDLKMIRIVGSKTRVGGTVNVYRVLTEITVKDGKRYLGEHSSDESVNLASESVNLAGVKPPQSNKVNNTYNHILETFNDSLGTSYRKLPVANVDYWLTIYSEDEICRAIKNIRLDTYWKDKMTLMTFFRQRNPNKEEVDRIGDFLNYQARVLSFEEKEEQKILNAPESEAIKNFKNKGI